ncbi:SecDF P1 head subdomain-containing protein [Nocardioides alkalitolerans]|uniref:SecDF P1 head subdomain-containing protein n=1 Tax=Nocardioides alkalitolerans TaxID=281714 RepID=UPI00042539AB|nr:hypothetical protein [Nocardioides alkalitolerans]
MPGPGGRAGRELALYVVLLGMAVGLVALTASWTPRWGVDVLAGTRVTLQPTEPGASRDDLDATARALEERASDAGTAGLDVRPRSDGSLVVTLPGTPDPRVVELLAAAGEVEVRGVVRQLSAGERTAARDDGAAVDPAALRETLTGPPRDAVDWAESPDPAWVAALASYDCATPVTADASAPSFSCDAAGTAYLLGPAVATGGDVVDVRSTLDPGAWTVELDLRAAAADDLDDLMMSLAATDAGRVALVVDTEVVTTTVVRGPLEGSTIGFGTNLDQRASQDLAARVEAGSLPVAVGAVDVARLGPTLYRGEGDRGALAAGAGLLAAIVAGLLLARRRALLPVAALLGTAALAAPVALVVDQAVGLPVSLAVLVVAAAAVAVAPVVAQHAAAAPHSGVVVWRAWWPPVALGLGAGVLVRVLTGGPVGDVAVALATVLGCVLVTTRLLTLPLGVRLAEDAPPVADRAPARRSGPVTALALAVLAVAAAVGLLVHGVATDTAFTDGQEHVVPTSSDAGDARGEIRDAVTAAGLPATSVRTAGDRAVLVTTPTLDDGQRTALDAALADVPAVAGPVATSEIRATGATGGAGTWALGAGVLAVALLAAALLAVRRAAPGTRAAALAVIGGATALAAVVALGIGAWAQLTLSPAVLAALAGVTLVAVLTQAGRVAAPQRDAGAALVATLVVVVPLLAVVVAAPSVRAPFAVLAAGLLATALAARVVGGRRLGGEVAGEGPAAGVTPATPTASEVGDDRRRTVPDGGPSGRPAPRHQPHAGRGRS